MAMTATVMQAIRMAFMEVSLPRLLTRRLSYPRVWQNAALDRAGHLLGARQVLRRIDVEEGVDRLGRPVGDRDPVPRGPDLDLAQVLLNERLAQVLPERDGPQAHDRMAP